MYKYLRKHIINILIFNLNISITIIFIYLFSLYKYILRCYLDIKMYLKTKKKVENEI